MTTALIPKEIRENLKYCFECGICTAGCPMTELLSSHYNPRSLLQKALIAPEQALTEDRLWLCAWCYRCYNLCPQGIKPPEIFHLLKREAANRGLSKGLDQAISIMRKDIPFPLVCWHTCFHPERAELNTEKVAAGLKKLVESQEEGKSEVSNHKGKVAVVGSGPAGLTAAWDLAEQGYSVTIFETLSKAGGMLRKSMPEYRLPRGVLDQEIQRLMNRGVEIRTSTEIGKDVAFNQLWQDGYNAVFVAVGAHRSRQLRIEGEELEGVVDALDMLWKVNRQQTVNLGKTVGIIGGGNVAVDAARTALRQGVDEVVLLYRRSREEMPANRWEVREAEREGVEIEFLVAPSKILGSKGKVAGLACIKMELGERDETGRRKPVPMEDSEFSRQFDTIIIAIGETVDSGFLPKEVKVDQNNRVWVNPFTMETSMPGVFAGGDATTGPASVMEAILAGKRAACAINQYLTELQRKEDVKRAN
jgi:NADH-quinone oxidoreductase subunit F